MALAVYLKDNIFIIIQIKIFSNIYWNFLDALFKLISNYLGFPGNSAGKESACNSGDPSSIPGLGSSPGEGIDYPLQYSWASLVVQTVRNLPAVREAWVQPLGWEDALEEGMTTHLSNPAWRIPMDRGAWRTIVHGATKSQTQLSDTAKSQLSD